MGSWRVHNQEMIGKKKKKLTDYIVHKVLDVYRVISRVLLVLYSNSWYAVWKLAGHQQARAAIILHYVSRTRGRAPSIPIVADLVCIYLAIEAVSQSRLLFFFSFFERLWVVKSLRTWTSYSGSYMWCKRWWLISGHSCSYRACISIDVVRENLYKIWQQCPTEKILQILNYWSLKFGWNKKN